MPKSKKLPAIQFYPGDWKKDPGVQALELHSRGAWFEILLLMHESEQRGILLLNGKPYPHDALARAIGTDDGGLTRALTPILTGGVASIDEETGALMCRRMVRDEKKHQLDIEHGKMGGNPLFSNPPVNPPDNPPVNPYGNPHPKPKTTPSSSSSISSLSSDEEKKRVRDATTRNPGSQPPTPSYEDGKWKGIGEGDKLAWKEAYSACDIDRELLAMIEWIKSNPEKGKKKNYRRFITNWLARSQERGGGMKSNGPLPPPKKKTADDILAEMKLEATR